MALWLAGVSDHPEAVWVIGALALAIAFASATQDIAIDAYAVEVLHREEQGIAAGARTALLPRRRCWSRAASSITLAAWTSWAFVNLLLALVYLPFMVVTVARAGARGAPRARRGRCARRCGDRSWASSPSTASLEILAFVVLYKLSDNLTQALTRPFLVQTGFGDFDVGVGQGPRSAQRRRSSARSWAGC